MLWQFYHRKLFEKMSLSRIAYAVGAFFILCCSQPVNGQEDAPPVPMVEYAYSFVRAPFVHPNIIEDLSVWLSDLGDQVVAINLIDAQGSNRYYGDVSVSHTAGECPFVYTEEESQRFGYRYIGMTQSGVHVLYTSDWGGGSGVSKHLMLLTLEFDYGIDRYDWDVQTAMRADKKRMLIKKLGEIGLGDRWSGQLSVSGNELHIGRDEGWFSQSGGTGGGPLSHSRADRVLKIDIHPPNPLDFAQHKHPCASGTQP